jgi:hypothetical protein
MSAFKADILRSGLLRCGGLFGSLVIFAGSNFEPTFGKLEQC